MENEKVTFSEDTKTMNPQDDLSRAIDAVRRRDRTRVSLDLLDRVVSGGDTARLLSGITDRERQSCQTEDEVITRTMRNLESLAEVSEPIACALMANLWSLAGDLYLHEICDAIDLWISACNSDKLTSQLIQMAVSEQDVDKQQHYKSLIQNRINVTKK